jgi:hypothetical protein
MALDRTTHIRKAKETVGSKMCIMRDVPASLLAWGTENEVYEYCRGLIRELGPNGLSCRPDAISRLMQSWKMYGR